MKIWIKVQSDGLIINRLLQDDPPVDCELGHWVPAVHPFLGPGWRILSNGDIVRPESFGTGVVTKNAFLARLSDSERQLLAETSETNSQVSAVRDYLNSLEVVNLYASQIGLAIGVLVENNVISKDRLPQITKLSTASEEPQFALPTLPSETEAP